MHLHLPEEVKKKLIEIFTYVTTACLTLTDPAKRKKYDRLPGRDEKPLKEPAVPRQSPPVTQERIEQKDEPAQPGTAVSPPPDIGPRRFRDGKVAFWDKNYGVAAYLFAAAISSDGSVAQYHYYYGAALGMLGKNREAVQALNRANELKPLDADILAELGHVYLRLHFPVRAKGYFDRALKLDPSNGRAKEGHNLMKGRKNR